MVNLMLMAVESLAEFVSRIRQEKGLSVRDVQDKSGGGISSVYVNQIENNHMLPEKLSVGRLQALAKGLGEPEEVIFALARKAKPKEESIANEKLESWSLKFNGMSPSKKERTKALFEMMDREIERIDREK